MKRLVVQQKKIFEVASFIKSILPHHKIHLYQSGNILTIELYDRLEYFKLEEIKTFLKIRYPNFRLNFVHRF
ncbi:MAG: hypothetical protein KatS3mg093_152 [Candidatus Parcubacteria bacterium]|nr:MAG: hypothetical protein KatS3mg093_152 [Candidatus Parcubacteria bacterium]